MAGRNMEAQKTTPWHQVLRIFFFFWDMLINVITLAMAFKSWQITHLCKLTMNNWIHNILKHETIWIRYESCNVLANCIKCFKTSRRRDQSYRITLSFSTLMQKATCLGLSHSTVWEISPWKTSGSGCTLLLIEGGQVNQKYFVKTAVILEAFFPSLKA